MKNLAIIGATGSTGKELIKLALAAGYDVTAIARNPTKIEPRQNLNLVKGDVTNLESLTLALKNMDYVISCFGPSHHKKVGNLMSLGTHNIVRACEENGVERFIFLSGFVQSDGKEFTYINRLAIKLLRKYYHESYNDKVLAEATIENSALAWVIVRAVALTHKAPTGEYKAGQMAKVNPFNALPYADCAQCLLDAIKMGSWTNQIINLGKMTD